MNEIFIKVIERIKDIKGLHTDTQVANALDMTKNNLYSFKVRKNLPLKQIHAFCSREGVRLEYIMNGTEPIYGDGPGPWPKIPGHGFGTPVSETAISYGTQLSQDANMPSESSSSDTSAPNAQFNLQSMLSKTAAVIESGTIFSSALRSNIDAFHFGLSLQRDLASALTILSQHTNMLQEQQEKLNQMNNLLLTMKEKQAG